MDEFEKYLLSKFSEGIHYLHHSPYAIGLDIYFVRDDSRQPVVRLITNTLEHAKNHSPETRKKRPGDAHSALEALWSMSYWILKTEVAVGTQYPSLEGDYYDAQGIAFRKKWVESLGLGYTDDFEKSDFEASLELGSQINEHFDELCLQLAQKLHPVITTNLKTDLPIIFFNRESPDHESLGLTYLANPAHLLREYARFLRAYYGDAWADFMESDEEKDTLTYTSLLNKWENG